MEMESINGVQLGDRGKMGYKLKNTYHWPTCWKLLYEMSITQHQIATIHQDHTHGYITLPPTHNLWIGKWAKNSITCMFML